MPYYIRLVSFTAEGMKEIKQFQEGREEFIELTKKLGIKVVAEYVTTGVYDVVTILEAPDYTSILKLTADIGSRGRTTVQTLNAVPAEEFGKIAKSA